MKTEGIQIIGYTLKSPDRTEGGFQAINPATEKPASDVTYYNATEKEMDEAMKLAAAAFERNPLLAGCSPKETELIFSKNRA